MNVQEIIENNYWLFPNITPYGRSYAIIYCDSHEMSPMKAEARINFGIDKNILCSISRSNMRERLMQCEVNNHVRSIILNMNLPNCELLEQCQKYKSIINTVNRGTILDPWRAKLSPCIDNTCIVDTDTDELFPRNVESRGYADLLQENSLNDLHTKDPCIITQVYLLYTLLGRHEEVIKWIEGC